MSFTLTAKYDLTIPVPDSLLHRFIAKQTVLTEAEVPWAHEGLAWLKHFDVRGELPAPPPAEEEEPVKPQEEETEAAPKEEAPPIVPSLETVKEALTVKEMRSILNQAKQQGQIEKGARPGAKEEELAQQVLDHGLYKDAL